jgi:maleylpyruvate isomerase
MNADRQSGQQLVLWSYFRSSTSHRVRIALNLKHIPFKYEAVSLPKLEHKQDTFLVRNPQGLVPVLNVDGSPLRQSPAILEWLEETYPLPPLLPQTPGDRARIRAMAALIASDVHPLNNLRVLNYLRSNFATDEDSVIAWCRHWIGCGFDALETLLAGDTMRRGFCFGAAPTLADCYLVPQVFSARRFGLDLAPYPIIRQIESTCGALQAFIDAQPNRQPDAA